jgi:hypothetical protein
MHPTPQFQSIAAADLNGDGRVIDAGRLRGHSGNVGARAFSPPVSP